MGNGNKSKRKSNNPTRKSNKQRNILPSNSDSLYTIVNMTNSKSDKSINETNRDDINRND